MYSRAFEKILAKRMLRHLHEHSVISQSQHGCWKGRPCKNSTLSYLNDWTSALDQNKPVHVIFVDFTLAFEKVSHKRLINKLKSEGIRPDVDRWLNSFFNKQESV